MSFVASYVSNNVISLAEVDGRRLLVAEVAELVLDQRVPDDGEARFGQAT
jgi:hypothetical protein